MAYIRKKKVKKVKKPRKRVIRKKDPRIINTIVNTINTAAAQASPQDDISTQRFRYFNLLSSLDDIKTKSKDIPPPKPIEPSTSVNIPIQPPPIPPIQEAPIQIPQPLPVNIPIQEPPVELPPIIHPNQPLVPYKNIQLGIPVSNMIELFRSQTDAVKRMLKGHQNDDIEDVPFFPAPPPNIRPVDIPQIDKQEEEAINPKSKLVLPSGFSIEEEIDEGEPSQLDYNVQYGDPRYITEELKERYINNYNNLMAEIDAIKNERDYIKNKQKYNNQITKLKNQARARIAPTFDRYQNRTGESLRDELINEGYDLDEKLKLGFGRDQKGLYSNEIEDMMSKDPNFKGVIALDEIKNLPISDKMSFIMNLDKSNQPGSHWVACHIDTINDKEVNYMDPFGEDPPKQFVKDIKHVIDKLKPDSLLKFKINNVKNQSVSSPNCGYHCMNFLNKRNSMSFKDATGYKEPKIDNSKQQEKEVKRKFKLI